MRKRILFIIFLLFYSSLSRADFSLYWRDSNYFLFEGRAYRDLGLNRGRTTTNVSRERYYSMFKLRMKPSLGITDRLSIHSMFDAFVSPTAQEGGAVTGQQATDTTDYGPNTGGNVPRNLLGSESAYGQSGLTSGDGNFLIKTAYVEYISDWGVLRLGRQPRQWGLGMRYNSGENLFDKFSDRTDTFSYELGLGNFKVSALASKIIENNINISDDDANLLEGYIHWNDPEKDLDVGFLYSMLLQNANHVHMNFFDGFFKKKSKKWKAGVEIVNSIGNPGNEKNNDAFQLGIASEFGYDWTEDINTYLKIGYASGPEIDRVGKLTTFVFDRNYDIALIMFNQGIGDIAAQTGVSVNSDPDLNAVFNAYYLNMGGQCKFNDRVGTHLGYVVARAPEVFTSGGNKNYGQEIDLSFWYQFTENMKFKLDSGAFFPGTLYRGSPALAVATDPSFTLLGSTILVF